VPRPRTIGGRTPRSIQLSRRQRAPHARTLAHDGARLLALAHRRRLLVARAAAQFANEPGFLDVAAEPAERDVDRLVGFSVMLVMNDPVLKR